MTDSTAPAARVWVAFYTIRSREGRVFEVQKSTDGCTRTVVVR